jgi:polyisoprenoid-binding protein YceI
VVLRRVFNQLKSKKKMKLTLGLSVITIASITALTGIVPPTKSNKVKSTPTKIVTVSNKFAKPVVFKVDNKTSKLTWLAKKATGEHSGTVEVSDGSFTVEGNTLKAGAFDIDTRSITDTDIADEGANGKLVTHLKSPDFFSVEKHPKANFVLISATKAAGNTYNVKGNLTIKGITNEVSFPATVAVSGKKLSANAKITIDRTKYDIKFRSKNFFENLGDKVIYDDFDIDVALVANAQ